jgi:hypothetical protein
MVPIHGIERSIRECLVHRLCDFGHPVHVSYGFQVHGVGRVDYAQLNGSGIGANLSDQKEQRKYHAEQTRKFPDVGELLQGHIRSP